MRVDVTPNLPISMTLMQVFGHESKPLLFSRVRIQRRYGTIMGSFQIFWYVVAVSGAFNTCLIDIPQPFMMRFPRADVHENLTPDLLHQAIKGTFKDHLVQWVEDYLKLTHGPAKAEAILDEIDRRYAKPQFY